MVSSLKGKTQRLQVRSWDRLSDYTVHTRLVASLISCSAAWPLDYLAAWLLGCLAAWPLRRLDAWLLGCSRKGNRKYLQHLIRNRIVAWKTDLSMRSNRIIGARAQMLFLAVVSEWALFLGIARLRFDIVSLSPVLPNCELCIV